MERLERELQRWHGTPYHETSCCVGGGVNCVRFVCAVADVMFRRDPMPPPHVPADRSLHDPEGARSSLRFLMKHYGAQSVGRSYVEPGDILATGPLGGGPGHAIIIGTVPNRMWQTGVGSGVHYTGYGPQPGAEVFYNILRVNKESW